MKWLLVAVWIAGAQVEVATERFETGAECMSAGQLLERWEFMPGVKLQWMCGRVK